MNGDLRYRFNYIIRSLKINMKTAATVKFEEFVKEINTKALDEIIEFMASNPGLSGPQKSYLSEVWANKKEGKGRKSFLSDDLLDYCVQGGGCSGK